MRLIKIRSGEGYAYINPEQVIAVIPSMTPQGPIIGESVIFLVGAQPALQVSHSQDEVRDMLTQDTFKGKVLGFEGNN